MHTIFTHIRLIEMYLARKQKSHPTRDRRSILTDIEISELILWIRASNDNNCGKTRNDIRLKIRQILIAPKNAISKAYSTTRHILKLTSAENNIVNTSNGPIDRWFRQFYAENSMLIVDIGKSTQGS
jgi:hypothetical protein